MGDSKGFLKYRRQEIPSPHLGTGSPEGTTHAPNPSSLPNLTEETLSGLLHKQAARCMNCGVSLCQGPRGCPVYNRIPEWNDLVYNNQWEEAANNLHSTNNFPEFTGHLCPAPCESACVLGIMDHPVTIKNIELQIVERAFQENFPVIRPQTPLTLPSRSSLSQNQKDLRGGGHRARVAIVGSGPAGLAAAQQLTRWGHEVYVFEKSPKAGGLLRYGIPDFKLEKRILDRRLNQLIQEGVIFKTSVTVGKDILLSQLKEQFHAVGLAMGAELPRDLNIPGRHLKGVHFAMEYLSQQNRLVSGEPLTPEEELLSAKGKIVAVLGGGDTGEDCVSTALVQGCKKVYQIEIRPRSPTKNSSSSSSTPDPRWEREWNTQTLEILGEQKVEALVTGLARAPESPKILETPEASRALGTQGEGRTRPVDMVLIAAGFLGPHRSHFTGNEQRGEDIPFAWDDRGYLVTDEALRTSVPGFFAGGDLRRGPSLVVWAIHEGRLMASSIHLYLENLLGEKS